MREVTIQNKAGGIFCYQFHLINKVFEPISKSNWTDDMHRLNKEVCGSQVSLSCSSLDR
jgi:hypothetical protein